MRRYSTYRTRQLATSYRHRQAKTYINLDSLYSQPTNNNDNDNDQTIF